MCMFCGSLFVVFHLAIVLSVILQFMDADYPFSIFKLLKNNDEEDKRKPIFGNPWLTMFWYSLLNTCGSCDRVILVVLDYSRVILNNFIYISQIVLKNFIKISLIIIFPEEILIKLAIVVKIWKSSWNTTR